MATAPRRRRSPFAPGAETLAAAAQAVSAVALQGRSADQALQADHASERAAVRAIALGTLRWYLRLAPAIDALVQRPSDSLAREIRALLVTAAHQVEYSRNAPELAVNVAVDATRVLGQPRASGFVNAILRRFVRERGALFERLDAERAIRTAHPQWFVEALDRAWPAEAERVLAANNAHPPLVLRVDLTRQTVEECIRSLADAGLAARALPWLPTAVVLAEPVPIAQIPGFAAGAVSIQDAGAQLAAPLLGTLPGMRVLDACAAPGGKTGHLLEHSGDIDLTAVDIDGQRLARVRENLDRLRRTARVVAGDVRQPESFWDGRPYDRILLDAPCSATGVIRRHPDIKLLRRPSDIPAMAAVQLDMLTRAFGLLAPGGRLLYVTCSVLPAENEDVVARFLAAEPAARKVTLELAVPGAIRGRTGLQLLPGAEAGSDGFNYACVEKATAGT
jgi:16S rRNA (cytosine967-C5)-methyltransferase